MAPDICSTKPGVACAALLCLSLATATPVPPRVLQDDTNVALLPRGSLPANFSVLSVALLPDAAVANVTLLPLQPPQLQTVPPGSPSVAEQLPLAPPPPPDLPPSAAGSAYVLSHVIIEVGVLEDDNSTDNSTDEPDDVDFTAKDVENGNKNETIKEVEINNPKNQDEVKGDEEKNNVKKESSKDTGKNGDGEKNESDKGKKETLKESTEAKTSEGGSSKAVTNESSDAKGSGGKETAEAPAKEKDEVDSGKEKTEESGKGETAKEKKAEGNKAAAESTGVKTEEGKDQGTPTPA